MSPAWHRRRGYRHFDVPVGNGFARCVSNPAFVSRHPWSPLISFKKEVKRYRLKQKKTVIKSRTIMYASHRDACILDYYSTQLNILLDSRYEEEGLSDCVIAYRKLGKANYHFAADTMAFVQQHAPCVVTCFDVTGFFDNLDHDVLKRRLCCVLGRRELPDDWYKVFRYVSRYRHVRADVLKRNPTIAERLKGGWRRPLATMAELRSLGITFEKNETGIGIPQGTPISAALSNLYMWELDQTMVAACKERDALYRRYSDDIIIVCRPEVESALTARLIEALGALKLNLAGDKTERIVFSSNRPKTFQYLGFEIAPNGAVIRRSSLSRQWRRMRRSIRRTRKVGMAAIEAGTANKIYTRKLRRKFLPVGVRNFSKYARSSARALNSKKILNQVRRLERTVEAELSEF